MIGEALRKAGADVWEELLLLIVFNLIWWVGTLLIIPWPFVTFGLFFVGYDISQGKAIKLTSFFAHARRMWKVAYIWGGVNVFVLAVIASNIYFYAGFAAGWVTTLQVFMIALLTFWLILQLIALPLYPRLEEPSLKLALRNALVIAGHQPLLIFVLVAVLGILGFIAYIFLASLFLFSLAVLAVIATRLVGEAVELELAREA
jgi:hypothetical protein